MPRVSFYLGRWMRTTDMYPDYQLRLYDRRHARWDGLHVHESVKVETGVVGYLKSELQHYPYKDLSEHLIRMDRYTTLAARQMFEKGKRATRLELLFHPPIAFARNYILKGGFRDGKPGLIISLVNSYYVMLKFAKLWELQTRIDDVFSIHVDTARTWRGGQRQVLLTVLGLRERGHRTVLVAHPEGELAGRASEGHDLIRLAPRAEVDLHAGWKLSRIIKDLRPDIVHAHDPHAVALASLALSFMTSGKCPGLIASRRVAFHLKAHAFSRWKYHQVDCFVAASNAIREMLIGDGIDADRVVTVYEGIDLHRVQVEPAANIHAEFWLPTHAPIVGAVARADAGEGAQVPHRRGSAGRARSARRAVRHSRRRRAAAGARASDQGAASREARRAARIPRRHSVVHQELRRVRHELALRRARHVAARRDGAVEADRRERHGRHSRGRVARRDGVAGSAAGSRASSRRRSRRC